MEKRMQDILSLLNQQQSLTSQELAEKLEVSSKTIRNDIKKLNEEIKENGAIIISKPNAGMFLSVTDKGIFTDYLKSMNTLNDTNDIPNNSQERIDYILDKLLKGEEFIKKEDLAEELFVSLSCLTQDLKEVKKELDDYNLSLEHKPNYGFRIKGEEFDLRLFITNRMLLKINNEYDGHYGKDILKKISGIMDLCFCNANYQMSSVAYQNLIVHIYIALQRVKEECFVPLDEETSLQLKQRYEFTLASQIVEQLQKMFEIEIPESEIGYITIHLVSKKIIDSSEEQKNLVITDEIYQIVTKMLEHVYEDQNIDLRDDLELRVLLALHLVPMEMRVRYNMVMKNPMLKDIKTKFTYAYNLAVCACDVITQQYHKSVLEDEIAYIALHFNLALEKQKKKVEDKKNLVIVCSTGRGSAELLVYSMKENFGKYINEIKTCDLLSFNKLDLSKTDYIISTIPIPYKVDIPILEIKYFLEDNDLKNISRLLCKSNNSLVSEYFSKELFIPHLNCKNKQDVLNSMCEVIQKHKKVPRNFYQCLIKREQQAVTEFGNQVAMPHPYKAVSDETFICIAILDKPIVWDKKKVQLVYLFSMSKNGAEDLQRVYRITSKFLSNSEYVKQMIKERDYQLLHQIFNEIEQNV